MNTVIGAFDSAQAAERAVQRLVESGIDPQDVHVERGGDAQVAHGTRTSAAAGSQTPDMHLGSSSGAATGGGVRGFFASLFGSEDEADGEHSRYSSAVNRGSSVVVVDAQDEETADRAAALLHELGAIELDEHTSQGSAMAGQQRAREPGQQGVLDVVQEQLQVGKRTLDRGGVRVIQRVTQQPVRELVRLREERAVVERRPVDRPATPEELTEFREGTLEIHERVEEPVVAKTARVVEEVRVGKEVREREETIEDTVRRKDVEVERLAAGAGERAVASDAGAMSEREAGLRRSSGGTGTPAQRRTDLDKPTE